MRGFERATGSFSEDEGRKFEMSGTNFFMRIRELPLMGSPEGSLYVLDEMCGKACYYLQKVGKTVVWPKRAITKFLIF